MMKKTLTLIFLLSCSIVYPQNSNSILEKIQTFEQSEILKHAQFSVSAKYVDNGSKIVSYNSEKSIIPASNLKVFTTAAALEILGEDYTYETALYSDGDIDGSGTLNGNLFFVGGGDPTLGSDNFEEKPDLDSVLSIFTKAVEKAGIKKIMGAVIVDNSRYDDVGIPGSWNWGDIGNYYGTSTSAFAINDNLYYLYFKPGNHVGDAADVIRTEPEIPGLKFVNNMKTGSVGSGDNGYIYNGPNSFEAVLRGTIPKGYDEFSIKGSIPNPALLAAQLFDRKLNESGISTSELPAVSTIGGNDYSSSKLILRTISPPLKDIVRIINKKSFNFYADMILKEMGKKVFDEGSFYKGIKAVEELFEEKGIDIGGLNIFDGSGLSRANVITTGIMTDLLVYMMSSRNSNSFFNSLPVAGDKDDIGSLRNFGNGTILEKRVFAKTGSIGGVRSHSGYVKTDSGRYVAFSIISNNYSGSSSKLYAIHKSIMMELVKLK